MSSLFKVFIFDFQHLQRCVLCVCMCVCACIFLGICLVSWIWRLIIFTTLKIVITCSNIFIPITSHSRILMTYIFSFFTLSNLFTLSKTSDEFLNFLLLLWINLEHFYWPVLTFNNLFFWMPICSKSVLYIFSVLGSRLSLQFLFWFLVY
jgi:hypothetical protein